MSESAQPDGRKLPAWLAGRGLTPRLKWSAGIDGSLTGLCRARESGDLIATDSTGGLTRINSLGRTVGLIRSSPPAVALSWSDDGSQGAIIAGENQVFRFDRSLKLMHRMTLPDVCLAIAVAPFGHHIAVSLANGTTLIFNERSRKIAQFESYRPLSFLSFCVTEPLLFGAAEHGLICCHHFSGAPVWQQTDWANVGALQLTGEGDLLYTASFTHGVQAFNGDGESVGSYVVDGTVSRVGVSYEPDHLILSTVEQGLYWLEADGNIQWHTIVPDKIIDVLCDPLGEGCVIGLAEQGIFQLDWQAQS
jgi:hypothetical protein